jgi:hypothetical protein
MAKSCWTACAGRVHDMGLPGKEVDLLVQWAGRTFGRYVLVPTPGLPLSLDRRLVAVALADQVAAAMAAAQPPTLGNGDRRPTPVNPLS